MIIHSGVVVGTIHDWSHQRRAKPIRDAAYADPTTRCWRCGLTLGQVQAANPSRSIVWHAGHTVTGDRWAALLAECSLCNQRDGQHVAATKAKGQPIRRSSGGTQRF